MSETARQDIELTLADTAKIEATLRRAVREALLRHKQSGNPVAAWKEGKVEWISPESLKLIEEKG